MEISFNVGDCIMTMTDEQVQQMFYDVHTLENIVKVFVSPDKAAMDYDNPISTIEQATDAANEYFNHIN